jgi:hypothetical protein
MSKPIKQAKPVPQPQKTISLQCASNGHYFIAIQTNAITIHPLIKDFIALNSISTEMIFVTSNIGEDIHFSFYKGTLSDYTACVKYINQHL